MNARVAIQLLTLSLTFLSAVGCGAGSAPDLTAAAEATPAAAADALDPRDDSLATAFPCTVVDTLGVETTLASRPQRIVSLSPRNTELLFAVQAGEQVVGVTSYCNYPEEARSRTQIGGYSDTSMSLEKIVSLQPELVVSDCAIHAPVVAKLRELGFAVVSIEADTLERMYADISLLGAATGHREEARELVAELQARVRETQEIAQRIPHDQRVTVFYEVWDQPLGAAGPACYLGKLIELCGGVNVIDDPDTKYALISHEFVIERDPDVILVPNTHADAFEMEDLLRRPGWEGLTAVREGRVYVLEGDQVSRFGPRFFGALASVGRLLYPDHFPVPDKASGADAEP